ncbi:L-ribulose-5-phosphate 4-epimerase [Alkalispirochaeta americana]|uniref:L-ribulose-5-phosphate 4-epimerase n=1 Tax=Alkalispirochaeta americana TaxID=159291 RepID=A0A1N6ULF9_9SPIO|nr:L-ribulose-5-phosphate 4-epimerase AraD [Alkalispirochaeta americana]SIQ66465.1 L-ribulose-5-phosphate 4-epimerase [Alkalispirochaeta americana]
MKYEKIKTQAYAANVQIVDAGLVLLTWGNASVRDPGEEVFAIKPSGVSYRDLKADMMVVVSIESGEVVEGELRPSSDTPTHAELYRRFRQIGGIVHTHSNYAVAFAQARRDIPLLGTTHADHFRFPIPVTRDMTDCEVEGAYEKNTGALIVETFEKRSLDPLAVPGVLVASHGPFAWGRDGRSAVENAIVLEAVARMACESRLVNPDILPAPACLTEKHFLRKHGPGAYYGQQ